MNSKDRRKCKRQFPSSVQITRSYHNSIITPHTTTGNVEDEDYDAVAAKKMDKWCNTTFGKGTWQRHNCWYFYNYKFKIGENATWFALKWVE